MSQLSVTVALAAMIGVTSRVAVAADAPPSVAPNTGVALSAAPQPPARPAPAVDLTARQPGAAQKQPMTSQWWFWTAIGAAVVGGVVAIYLAERAPSPPGCPTAMGFVCPR